MVKFVSILDIILYMYSPPTSIVQMKFKDWLKEAYKMETAALTDDHYYLQLNAVGKDAYVFAS